MKYFYSALTLASSVLVANIAAAAPLQYQFSTVSPLFSPAFLPSDTQITGTFTYDANNASTIVDNAVGSIDVSILGAYHYSIYSGAISNLIGSVNGHSFSADNGSTLVEMADTTSNCPTACGGFFSSIGSSLATYGINGSTDNFSGFSLGDYELVGFMLQSVDFSSTDRQINSLSLPNQYPGIFLTTLRFADNNGGTQDVIFFSNLAPVPLPASAWLFGSAVTGLLSLARRKK